MNAWRDFVANHSRSFEYNKDTVIQAGKGQFFEVLRQKSKLPTRLPMLAIFMCPPH